MTNKQNPGFPPPLTHRVGSGEVVAPHHLHVGLLYQGHPQLVPVARVGAEQLSITIHRKEVIYDHLQPAQSKMKKKGNYHFFFIMKVT